MNDILNGILPVFLIIAIGWAFRRLGLFAREDGNLLSRAAFVIALPAMIFRSVATMEISAGGWAPGLLCLYGGYVTVGAICIILAKVKRLPKQMASSFLLSIVNGNYAYIGLPIIGFAYGAAGTAVGALMLGLLAPWVAVSSVVADSLWGPATNGGARKGRQLAGAALKRFVTNPLLIASFLGIAFNLTGLPLPVFIDRSFNMVGGAAAPLGLLAIGFSLNLKKIGDQIGLLLTATIFRLGLISAVVWGLAQLLPVTALTAKVVTLMMASPSAVAAYVIVKDVDGDGDFAAALIIVTTLLSPLTIGLIQYLLH